MESAKAGLDALVDDLKNAAHSKVRLRCGLLAPLTPIVEINRGHNRVALRTAYDCSCGFMLLTRYASKGEMLKTNEGLIAAQCFYSCSGDAPKVHKTCAFESRACYCTATAY